MIAYLESSLSCRSCERARLSRIHAIEVARLDPKPLKVRATDPLRVEVYRAKRHQTLAPPFSGFVLPIETKFDCIVAPNLR